MSDERVSGAERAAATARKARTISGWILGILLILSALAHALVGWPELRAELSGAGAGEELVGALAVGWFFGSMAMLVFGLIVLRIMVRRADPDPLRFIAVGYLVFGVVAFVARGFETQFLLLIIMGLLLAIHAFSEPG